MGFPRASFSDSESVLDMEASIRRLIFHERLGTKG
jgi:hypothetical protein